MKILVPHDLQSLLRKVSSYEYIYLLLKYLVSESKIMISDLIKENTQARHQALESAMIRRIKAIEKPADYVEILKVFYSYFGGLERQINQKLSGVLPDQDKRRKTESIAVDIRHFGGTVPALAPEEALPEMETPLQAMVALYVIEGSTLGGIYISKMVQKRLELESLEGLSFFEGYGEQTEAMWEQFKSVLNALPSGPEEEQQMLATANDTFWKFQQWMEK